MTGMLQDKAVLVTGAAGGIGRAAALIFAREGASVAVADRDAKGAEETTRQVEAAGGKALAVTVDLLRPDEVEAMVARTVEIFGRLDGAFNNAGITGGQVGQGGRFLADWDEAAFDNIVGVNLKGTFLAMRAEIRQMLTQEGGAIVNTASLAGVAGFPTTAGYAASKHGVVGLTKTAALEYAPNLRINALCPGYVDTALLKDTMERRAEQVLAKIPFGRLADPAEIAEMACWLLSNRASYCSGSIQCVDGAYMAG